jgi:hypothetical protein
VFEDDLCRLAADHRQRLVEHSLVIRTERLQPLLHFVVQLILLDQCVVFRIVFRVDILLLSQFV